MPKSSWISALPLVLLACGGAPPPQLTAADVVKSEVVPSGYRAVGSARAHCGGTPAWGRLSGQSLASFDCSFAELDRELREQTARAGGDVLADVHCAASSGGALSCSGTMARASAPGLRHHADASEPRGDRESLRSSELRHQIEVDVEPSRERFSRRPRAASDVGEARALPVSHVDLGSIRARCAPSACDERDLRLALRMAAGGLGVSDLVGVSCATFAAERECLATLSATELDADADSAAR